MVERLNFAAGNIVGSPVAPLVVGFCGQKAAGKDIASEYLVTRHGFRSMGFGDAVRMTAREDYGMISPEVGDLIRIGNEGRQQSGDTGYWAGRLIAMIQEQGIARAVVQGIRNPGEIDRLQRDLGERFFLIGITAPLRLRAERLMARSRGGDPVTLEAFMDLDDADRGIGQPHDGQRTDDCLARVEFSNRFVNSGSLDAYHNWLDGRVESALSSANCR